MSAIATIRPDAWNFPLLLHLIGAMAMVGCLILSASALVLAWRDGAPALVRLGYRSLLVGALPAWLLMRVGGEWVASKEDLTGSNAPSWVDIGFNTADIGLLLLVIATVTAGLAVRRIRRDQSPGPLGRVPTGLVALLLVAYLVAIWAMTTKPT
ncbi:MAG TPA: hypothetical protein VH391_00770 [Solirubrobacterales bacterium]|jgi:hypothetical protein